MNPHEFMSFELSSPKLQRCHTHLNPVRVSFAAPTPSAFHRERDEPAEQVIAHRRQDSAAVGVQ